MAGACGSGGRAGRGDGWVGGAVTSAICDQAKPAMRPWYLGPPSSSLCLIRHGKKTPSKQPITIEIRSAGRERRGARRGVGAFVGGWGCRGGEGERHGRARMGGATRDDGARRPHGRGRRGAGGGAPSGQKVGSTPSPALAISRAAVPRATPRKSEKVLPRPAIRSLVTTCMSDAICLSVACALTPLVSGLRKRDMTPAQISEPAWSTAGWARGEQGSAGPCNSGEGRGGRAETSRRQGG